MTIGEIVNLQFIPSATNRTKNRIRENGPEFVVLSDVRGVRFDSGRWVHLKSTIMKSSDGKGGKESWSGWLPIKEIFNTLCE